MTRRAELYHFQQFVFAPDFYHMDLRPNCAPLLFVPLKSFQPSI